MRFAATTIRSVLVILAFGIFASRVAAEPQGDAAIVMEPSPSLVTFAGGTAKSGGRLKVRIAGPDGEIIFESVSKSGLLDWVADPALPDGQYRWDAWLVPQGSAKRDSTTETDVHYRSGKFTLEGGSIRVNGSREVSASPGGAGAFEYLVGRVLETVVPTAAAVGSHNDAVVITDNEDDGRTYVALDSDLSNGGFNVRWQIWNFDERLEFNTYSGGNKMTLTTNGYLGIGTNSPAVPLQISDTTPRLRFADTDGFGASGPTAWTISASSDELRLQDNDGGGRPIVVDAGGDSGGAPTNSFYISSGDGDIGMGTSTPDAPLHITDPSPQVRFERSGSDSWLAGASGASAERFFIGTSTLTQQFSIERAAPAGSLEVDASGALGVGTLAPTASVHVSRNDGSAGILVEDTGGTSPLSMFELENNGYPRFTLNDTSTGEAWDFRLANGKFTISRVGTGGPEFEIFNDGSAEFRGQVVADGMLLTSARSTKTGFAPVDGTTLLAKLEQLDVSQWRYREGDGRRHIGPMAGDFRRVFGLGDGRHINAVDGMGVSLAAAKALQTRVSSLSRENRELRSELEAIRDRLERLEAVRR